MLPAWSTNWTSTGCASSPTTSSSARSGGRCPRSAHRRGERGGQGDQGAHIARTAAQVPVPPQDALALDSLLLRVHGGQGPVGHHPSVYRSPEGGLGREDFPLPPVPLRRPASAPGEHGRDVPPPAGSRRSRRRAPTPPVSTATSSRWPWPTWTAPSALSSAGTRPARSPATPASRGATGSIPSDSRNTGTGGRWTAGGWYACSPARRRRPRFPRPTGRSDRCWPLLPRRHLGR